MRVCVSDIAKCLKVKERKNNIKNLKSDLFLD